MADKTIKLLDEIRLKTLQLYSQNKMIYVSYTENGCTNKFSGIIGKIDFVEKENYQVVDYRVIPDEQALTEQTLITLCDDLKVDLVLTTGGTGFSMRDRTPEATLAVADRLAPGISEAIRAYSMQFTNRAMLSRGTSVIRGATLIINLPGFICVIACIKVVPFIKHIIQKVIVGIPNSLA